MGGADLALLVVVLCALASVVVLFQTVSTQDRRSEENMAKDLLENLPVPVFVLDDDFRIIRYNGLFESLVGKAPLERFLYEGKNFNSPVFIVCPISFLSFPWN